MKNRLCSVVFLTFGLLSSPVVMANDAVLGAVLGGGAGAIVGRSIGGRDGTIIGGALGAAAGAAIGSQSRARYVEPRVEYYEPAPVYYPPVHVYRPAPPAVYYVHRGYGRDGWNRHPHYDHHDRGHHRDRDRRH